MASQPSRRVMSARRFRTTWKGIGMPKITNREGFFRSLIETFGAGAVVTRPQVLEWYDNLVKTDPSVPHHVCFTGAPEYRVGRGMYRVPEALGVVQSPKPPAKNLSVDNLLDILSTDTPESPAVYVPLSKRLQSKRQ